MEELKKKLEDILEVESVNAEDVLEDFDYWQRMCSRLRAVALSEVLYEYRFHDGALTSTMKKDLFYKNMKSMLMKNRPLFGKITWEQKLYFYSALSECAKHLNESDPYKTRVRFYNSLYFIKYSVFGRFGAVKEK